LPKVSGEGGWGDGEAGKAVAGSGAGCGTGDGVGGGKLGWSDGGESVGLAEPWARADGAAAKT